MSKLNQSWSIILIILTLLMRIVLSFVWSEFSSIGREEWCIRWRMDKSSSLGMPMSPQEIFKRYKRQSLGMPKHPLLHQQKYQVLSQYAIFLLMKKGILGHPQALTLVPLEYLLGWHGHPQAWVLSILHLITSFFSPYTWKLTSYKTQHNSH